MPSLPEQLEELDQAEFEQTLRDLEEACEGKPPMGRRSSDPGNVEAKGTFVQWAKNGPGWVPTTKTVKALDPGAYHIAFINDNPTFVPMKIVADDLVRLPDSKSDEVVTEIERFWGLKGTFFKYGYNHKRGFLLHGPPGSGKTSTIITVTQQMIERGGLVIVGGGAVQPIFLAQMLGRARMIEPDRPIVVILEDIDTLIKEWGEAEILAMLDGELSISGAVFIATTNYPSDLDKRITNRPSRFDRVVEIPPPNAESRMIYLKSRNMELPEEELAKWVKATEGMSIAHCKELVVATQCFGDSFDATIKRLKGMSKTPETDEGGGGTKRTGFSVTTDEDESD